jgi:hypothetical protein
METVPPPDRGGTVKDDIDMDLRRKNILLAVLIGLFAVGLYIYAIVHVMSDTGLPK